MNLIQLRNVMTAFHGAYLKNSFEMSAIVELKAHVCSWRLSVDEGFGRPGTSLGSDRKFCGEDWQTFRTPEVYKMNFSKSN